MISVWGLISHNVSRWVEILSQQGLFLGVVRKLYSCESNISWLYENVFEVIRYLQFVMYGY